MISSNELLYYDQGYFLTRLPDNILSLLWKEIYTTEWVADTAEGIYTQIPSWYQSDLLKDLDISGKYRRDFERQIGKEVTEKAPASFINIARELVTTENFEFFNNYYTDSQVLYVDLWNGSEEIPYHFDTINGADTLVLIYLTDEPKWDNSWGGQISLKKQVGDVIITEDTYNPTNGTMLVINNTNPLVTHRVRAMADKSINRYTVSFNYKWK